VRYAQVVSRVACTVAPLCLISWLFKLSILVRLVIDSILVGFKADAGLTIIMSQLPNLLGVPRVLHRRCTCTIAKFLESGGVGSENR
jgi:MFS superfamily sulfate permease-like transporter